MKGGAVLVHGRGATAESILSLVPELAVPDLAYVAPQAPGNTWYPESFLAPMERNEPWLSHALQMVGDAVGELDGKGIPREHIALLGFSQGACLMLEFAARNAARYGALVGWSGGLIGPRGTPRAYPGSFDGTPVFLGCSDRDPHVPAWRVEETADVLTRMGAEVDLRFYPGLPHTVNEDELQAARALLQRMTATT
ncbi:MAG TPA: dienelactone hydrolase family protein [Candidatus Polarisedimenticolaceae bacterium]|nr:dienelactone hydrolase family protein [Candidatus Polarisedimenticolaceae bacterium]